MVLIFYATLIFIGFSIILPRCLFKYKEINEMIAERRIRFNEIRKLQKNKKFQAHVPLHYLRSYYDGDTSSSSASDTEQRHVISAVN